MWMLLLLVACVATVVSCARLCRAAIVAGALPGTEPGGALPVAELGLYETAFLSGGPHRVTDLTLVSMAGERRLLLAHTGWATVVDTEGRDDLERSLIASIGPAGQSPVAAIRVAHAAAGATRALGERLAGDGLAVPAAARESVTAGIRQVRGALALNLLMFGAAMVLSSGGQTGGGQAPAWFSLPLLLTTGCWIIARAEVHPYTRWASPAGQDALRAVPDGPGPLAALAVRGPGALVDPAQRAALA
ncbi:TIGR04222 domain-containing membrane protein [Streptomyces sp. H39-S7]|uniref:TIGR04222 domain-containing membrane protein n=1 Tax=Streptomyces sp. H39-S7 TaxID=3004357 RepID=UPI0022AE96C0|nr:TIGR04222 domain-containing membrane protein [Streptomyces sp. H39-S7]MCZ4121814.1 TIGR04222 domain-containing membrane protein [Streptomyces sp. H39-S7]